MKYCSNCGNKIDNDIKFCGKCGNQINNEIGNSKRDMVLGDKKSNASKRMYVNLIFVALFALVLSSYFVGNKTKAEKVIDEQPEVVSEVEYPPIRTDMTPIEVRVENGKIIIPLDEVIKNKFVKYSYKAKYQEVPLLAYINGEGKVITSISMCEPCDSRTFHIVSDELVCNSCGSTWNLNDLDPISGSCSKYPPDPIPSKVINNEIQIDVKFVENWKRRV